MPDLTPPVTSVDGTTGTNPSTVNTATGTFTLNITGSDPGGGVADLFRGVRLGRFGRVHDGKSAPPSRPGRPTAQGTYHATHPLPGPDRRPVAHLCVLQHRARRRRQRPAGPVDPQRDASTETFAAARRAPGDGLHGRERAVERSFIRYLDIDFNESDSQSGGELTPIVNSIGTSSPDIQLYKYDLNGDASSKTAVSLSGVNVST